jgi:hypothetical protein
MSRAPRAWDVEAIDAATAELYEQVRASPRHRDFIRRIESDLPVKFDGRAPRLVVMPGAFHAQHANTGADGRRVLELAAQLGWPAEVVPAPSLGSLSGNADVLAEVLRRRGGEPIILVSLSKGGADVRTAMDRPAAAGEFRDVRAWVNISGIVTGTALVGWLRARPLRCWGVRLLLRCRGQRWAQVEELRRGAGAPLARPIRLPPHVRAIHIAGFPRVGDLTNDWARRGHARLAPLGPNDGGGILLRDLLELPGEVFPVRGADHYLNPSWDIRPLLRRVLLDAAAHVPPDPPVGRKAEQRSGDDVDQVMLLGRERRVEDQPGPRNDEPLDGAGDIAAGHPTPERDCVNDQAGVQGWQ